MSVSLRISGADLGQNCSPIKKRTTFCFCNHITKPIQPSAATFLKIGPVTQRLAHNLAGGGIGPRIHRSTKPCDHFFRHGYGNAFEFAHAHTKSYFI